jgi:Lamin Tail Domain
MNRLTRHILSVALALGAAAAHADAYLPAMGGGGGGQYITPCPAGQNLGGFQLRTGDDVDAMRPACVASLGPTEISAPPVSTPWTGGPDGRERWVVCPASTPIVIGMRIEYEGIDTITVNSIELFCGVAVAVAQPLPALPAAIFDGPKYVPSEGWGGIGIDGEDARRGWQSQSCPPGQVAIGVHGKSGAWVDSMGLICAAPRLTAPGPTGKALGRVKTTAPTGPAMSICDAAKSARARNSPAAPGLEAQCLASQPPAKSLGRVETPFIPGPPRPICEVANEARARNSPAAPGLEAQCRAELATHGEEIASRDPLTAELRRRTRNEASLRGFDLGMAVAQNDTLPGPGKQRIHDALTGVEQSAYDAAVSFLLQRNKNAELAATGAAIAAQDSVVAKARTADSDVFYALGFDIATGIFGDPSLGARGNTAVGPGSLGIRDGLSSLAQRGFNGSVALHLSRHYARAPAVASNLSAANASSMPSAIVISQVYGGGGTVGNVFASDFVELLNRGAEPLDLSGWSIQYASANGVSWQVTPLGGTLSPGSYLLIQEAGGAFEGAALPTADLIGRISLAAAAGKVALVRTSTPLSGYCPASPDLMDFVGYGSANCAEGGMPVADPGRAASAIRNAAGCDDTGTNAPDFQGGAPTPRNRTVDPVICAQ